MMPVTARSGEAESSLVRAGRCLYRPGCARGDDAGAEPSGGLDGDRAESLGGPGQGYVQVPFPTGAVRDDLLGVHDDDSVEFQAARFGRRHDACVVSDALGCQLAHPGVRADHSQKLARVRGALGAEFLNDGGDQPVREVWSRCGGSHRFAVTVWASGPERSA